MKQCILLSLMTLIVLGCKMAMAEVLELGESEVKAKKEQPEVLTFIAPSRIVLTKKIEGFNAVSKIMEDVKNTKVFQLHVD